MINLLWSQNTIEQKFQKLLTEINLSSSDNSGLATLQQFEKFNLKSEEIFAFLEDIALSHRNDKIRYVAAKLLFKNYPEESIESLRSLLAQDLNYKIRVFNLTDSKRYNFNDMLNNTIKQIKNKDRMIEDIIKYNYTEFALSWKDYLDIFNVFYNIELKCFILNFKNSQKVAYLVNRISDPFYELRVGSILDIKGFRYIYRNSAKLKVVFDFLRRFLHVKNNDLKVLPLIEQEDGFPNYRIFCDSRELLVYLHL